MEATPKFCSNCGAPLGGGKFCAECGAPALAIPSLEEVPDEPLPTRSPIPETATFQGWQVPEYIGRGWSVLRDDGPTVLMVKGSVEEYQAAMASRKKLTLRARTAVLESEIQLYIARGFKVVSRTETTAQLVRPRTFSCFWAFVWLLLLIGVLVYLIYYLSKSDDQVYLSVDEYGEITYR